MIKYPKWLMRHRSNVESGDMVIFFSQHLYGQYEPTDPDKFDGCEWAAVEEVLHNVKGRDGKITDVIQVEHEPEGNSAFLDVSCVMGIVGRKLKHRSDVGDAEDILYFYESWLEKAIDVTRLWLKGEYKSMKQIQAEWDAEDAAQEATAK